MADLVYISILFLMSNNENKIITCALFVMMVQEMYA